jgi:hypothetical protein
LLLREIKHKEISVACYYPIPFMNIRGISTEMLISTKKEPRTFLNFAIIELPLPLEFVNMDYYVFCGILKV